MSDGLDKLKKMFNTVSWIPDSLIDLVGDKTDHLYNALYDTAYMLQIGHTKDEAVEYLVGELSEITGVPYDEMYPTISGIIYGVIGAIEGLIAYVSPPDPCPLNAGNVTIGKYSFYAEEIRVDPPYQKRVIDEVKIEGGKPKHYLKGYELRKVTFTAKVTCPLDAVQKKLNELHGKVVNFSSTQTGAFNAYVNYKTTYPAGTVNYVEIEFEVMETTSELPKEGGSGGG